MSRSRGQEAEPVENKDGHSSPLWMQSVPSCLEQDRGLC